MALELSPGIVRASHRTRLVYLREIEEKLEQVHALKNNLKGLLLKAVPIRLHALIEQEGVIDNVVNFGEYRVKLRLAELGLSARSIRAEMRVLAKAWEGNISVRLEKPDGGIAVATFAIA